VATFPDLATAATDGQVSNPDPGGKPAVRQTTERKDRMGPPTLWHQGQLEQDPLSPVLDERPVEIVEVSEIRQHSMPPLAFRFVIISSYVTTTNARAVGLVLTVLNLFHLFPSGPLAQIAKGALTLYRRVNATGRFRPGGSWRGQRSGVRACFHDSGPGSKSKTSVRRSAFTGTGRLRPASDTGRCPYSLATRHSPSAIPDSEFGDPELAPLGMRDMLQKATFPRIFRNFEKPGFDTRY